MKKFIEFNAVILQREGMKAAYIEFPFDTQQLFGIKGRVPVMVHFDDVMYRGSLVKMKTPCHIIGLNKDVRKQLGKEPGESVHVRIMHDESKRKVEVPAEVSELLSKHPDIQSYFEKLSFTNQKEYVTWITGAKKPETRARRLNKMLEMLNSKVKHP